ncbi:hypothetical protein JCM8547_001364 [Rhodosporidiobolus lusitaniae]
MTSLVNDSQSPEIPPTCLATSPSAAARTAVDATTIAAELARKVVKRTYGGKRVEIEAPPSAEAAPARALIKEPTFIVPETEPFRPSSPGNHAVLPARTPATSSSPTRRDVHSTDPTSEDEESEKGVAAESSDESEGEAGGIEAFLKRGRLSELMAQVDDDFDKRADDPVSSSTLPTLTPSTRIALSSDLPHLTTSEPGSSSQAPVARRTGNPPLSPSSEATILDEIFAALPPQPSKTRDAAEFAPRAKKVVARIVDSEDEEDMPQASRKGKQRAGLESSDREEEEADEQDSSPVKPRASVAPVPSAKERVLALAAKKRKEQPPVDEKKKPIYEDAEDMIEGDDEDDGEKKKKRSVKKKRGTKSLSKKEQEEMHKQTAAFARTAEVRLEATRKVKLSVSDALKQVDHAYLPTPPVTRPPRATADPIVLSSTSDAIMDSSSPAPSRGEPAKLSLKALGKRREASPLPHSSPIVDLAMTPVPHRSRLPPKPLGWVSKKTAHVEAKEEKAAESGSDEDLLSVDAMLEKSKKEREEKIKAEEAARAKASKMALLQEKKREALRLAAAGKSRATAAADSDSDIEIEGAPGKSKKASALTSTSKDHRLEVFEQVKAEPYRSDKSVQKMFRTIAGVDIYHPLDDDDEPTESQLQSAGKEFGRNLDPKQHHMPTPVKTQKTKRRARPARAAPHTITLDSLNSTLFHRSSLQSHAARVKKQTKHRQEQARAAQPELEGVDVSAMLKRKKEQEDKDQEMEDGEDGDYLGTDEEEEVEDDAGLSAASGVEDDGDEAGSGSDVPSGRDGKKKGDEEEEEGDEDEVDSDGELRMPPSSQNSDRLAHVRQSQDEQENEEESAMPPPAFTGRRKVRIADDEEELSEAQPTATVAATLPAPTEVVTSPAAPVDAGPVALGGLFGGDDGGEGNADFSQFFNSQFSQEAGAGQGAQADGFLRPANDEFAAPAATMFVGQPLISTAERAADAARLEARGGFNDLEPGTPREAPAARQYINQQGFLTQTRPANLFADSPSDSPAFAFRHSLSTLNSESQLGADTQVQTPTQASKDPNKLRRLGAMVTYGSIPDTEVQPEPTEVVRSATIADDAVVTQVEETQEETQEESFPTAAQPPTAAGPNAFDLLRQGAAQKDASAAPVQPKRKGKSVFVDAEANLSDEEQLGLGGVSGDEDENGMDAELESLVDNEEIDKELREEQDARVDERFAEDMEKQDQDALKRAERIVGGKERHGKGKGLDLSDDEFDDEYIRREKRAKRARIETASIAQLKENEETQAFAAILTDNCIATSKANEYSYLDIAEQDLGSEDDGDDEQESPAFEEDAFGRVENLPAVRTFKEARALALRTQQERDEEEDVQMFEAEDENEQHRFDRHCSPDFLNSSSPAVPLRTNNRIEVAAQRKTTVLQVDEFAAIDSQYSYLHRESFQATVQYKGGDGRDESQSAAAAGGRSAVTSFKRSAPGKNSSAASAASKNKGGKNALGPKPSRLGGLKKGGGFA